MTLYNTETIIFYGFPNLFFAEDDDNNSYIAQAVKDNDQFTEFIFCHISEQTKNQFLNNEIDLRTLIKKCNSFFTARTQEDYYQFEAEPFTKPFPKKWLPDKGLFYN